MEKLPFDFMNAAGWVKTVEHVKVLAKVGVLTHIVAGSFTVQAREGNTDGNRFAILPDGSSVNALGLPNGGIPYLKQHLREMIQMVHDANKKLVVSVAGFSPEEYAELVWLCFSLGVDIVEENWGCPNVFGKGGSQKAILSYSRAAMEETFDKVERAVGRTHSNRWIKFSPFANPDDRVWVVGLISSGEVSRIVAANTFPNVRARDAKGNPVITAKNTDGRAGFGGTAIKYINLTNAEHYCELLAGKSTQVIGVGGIRSGADLEDYHRVGCAGVQVATAFFATERPRALEDIATDWIMNYHTSQ